MQQQYRAYQIFRIVIFALCVAVSVPAVMVSQSIPVPWSHLLFLIAIATLCELAPVALGANYAEVTLVMPLIMMTMLVYGTLPVIILGSSAFILASALGWSSALLSHRFAVPSTQRVGFSGPLRAVIFNVILAWVGRPWVGRHSRSFGWLIWNLLYNASHLCLNTVLASLVYTLAGGTLLSSSAVSTLTPLGWIQTIGAAMAAMAVFFVSDAGVYGVATALYESLPAYTRTFSGFVLRCQMLFRQTITSVYKSDIVLAALGAVLTLLYLKIGTTAVIVLFGTLYMIRDAVRQTFQQIQTYRDTVTTLGTYMQRYHPYTRGHLKRVADLSERLAKELKLPLESVMMMPDAGMLHDIGKVGVSEDILDKVGKLTDEEWTVIKQHPVKGAEIVSHLPFLDKIVDWVKYHHKWADGTGYPEDGKKDGQIPVEATIIAVADAFDAMTDDRELSVDWQCDTCGHKPDDGDRPEYCPKCGVEKKRIYRQPLSLDDAVDQLRRGAGSQFSPVVVKAFLRMLERDGVHING